MRPWRQRVQDGTLIAKHAVRVKVVGQLELLPPGVQQAAAEVMQASERYSGVTLNICLAYSCALRST